jgi:hypothetical protein
MKLTQFNGHDGRPILIDTDKIMGVQEHTDPSKTTIILQAGSEGEEWVVNNTLVEVTIRIQP